MGMAFLNRPLGTLFVLLTGLSAANGQSTFNAQERLSKDAWVITAKTKPQNATGDAALLGTATYGGKMSGAGLLASCDSRNYGPVPTIQLVVPTSLGYPVPGASNSRSVSPTIINVASGDAKIGSPHEATGRPSDGSRNFLFFFDASDAEFKSLAQHQPIVFSIQTAGASQPVQVSFITPADSAPLDPLLHTCTKGENADSTHPELVPRVKAKYEIRGLTVGMTPQEVAEVARAAGLSVSGPSKPSLYTGAVMNVTDPEFQYSGQARAGTTSLKISIEFSVATNKAYKVSAWEGACDSTASATSGRLHDAGVEKWGKPVHGRFWGDPTQIHAEYDWKESGCYGQPIALFIVDPVAKSQSEKALNPAAPKPKL